MRRILVLTLSTLVLLNCALAQGPAATGSVRGQVVTRNQNGEPAVLPNVQIVLQGPMNKDAESDESGAFAIDGLPPGLYEIEASAPGLSAMTAVEVKPGTAAVVPIELAVSA